MADPPLGVGIDIEERSALDHLDESVLQRAAARWLTRAEREWCAAQLAPRESLLVVLCCKEAAYKAWRVPSAVHEVSLAMDGCIGGGRALARGSGTVRLEVAWRLEPTRIVALAAAGVTPTAA